MAGKGSRPGERRGGRKKGTPNRRTADGLSVRAAIEAAFDNLGGVDALVTWAKGAPDAFYTKLWAKLLPTQVDVTGGVRVEVAEEVVDAPDRPSNGEAARGAAGVPPV